jgi:hypothetical protein
MVEGQALHVRFDELDLREPSALSFLPGASKHHRRQIRRDIVHMLVRTQTTEGHASPAGHVQDSAAVRLLCQARELGIESTHLRSPDQPRQRTSHALPLDYHVVERGLEPAATPTLS